MIKCYNSCVDERSYIENKQESWQSLSNKIDRIRSRGLRSLTRAELESVGSEYRGVVSDLSFARSQGASNELVIYLNELAARAHGILYATSGASVGGLWSFLIREFPALFRSTIRHTLVATLIFMASWAGAAYLVITDPSISHTLMPEKLQAKDVRNAKSPIPDPAQMSSYIMTNNIKVGILSFAGGISAGVITVFEMVQNGAMLGVVATLFSPIMGRARFWSYILPHGIIELVAIFICGGAGLMIGSAMIAPGNMRRADAIRLASGKALRLFAGTIPLFVVAGTIEGFITPSVLPIWSKLTFAAITAIGLIAYLGFAGGTKPNIKYQIKNTKC
ncbi:MAG: stage II sporulation protein M [Armatimonadota bacterium]